MDTKPTKTKFVRTMYFVVVMALLLSTTGQVSAQEVTPRIEAFAWFDRYSLVDWPMDLPIEITIENPAYQTTFTPDGSSNWYDLFPGVDLQPGTVITATNGETAKVLEISPLSAEVDSNTGIVTGVATADSTFHMTIEADQFQQPIEQDIEADSAGNWSVAIAGDLPLVWLTRGLMWEWDDDGDVTQAFWHVHNEIVEVWLAQNEIRAFDWPLNTDLTFNVDGVDIAAAFTQPLDWIEGTSAVVNAGDLRLEPGMTVTVTDGITSTSTIIQDLKITHADSDQDLVYGYAPSNASLELGSFEDDPHFRFFNAEADGSWIVDYRIPSLNGVSVDVSLGDTFTLFMREDDKDATVWEWNVTNPRMVVSITHDWFRAEEFSPGGTLNVKIYEEQGGPILWEENRTADESGFIVVGEWEHPVDLKPGNYLVISDGATTKGLMLEAVTLDVFDPSMDYLAGTAPPAPGGRPVWVGTGNDSTGCGMDVIADPVSGAWVADFSTQPCDVTEDMGAAAQVFDEDGDASEGNLPRNPIFTVFPEWEAIEGWFWTQDATVHLEIDDPSTPESPDYFQDAQVVPTPWNPNEVWVRFDFAGVYDVKPGDVVTLSEGTISRTHTVENLAISTVNEVEDTVSGTAEEGETIYVWPHATGQQVEATAGSEGAWDVDFTGIFDLVPGECGRSEVRDVTGNSTAVDWCIPNPHFSAFPEWESIEGWEWPLGANIHLTIDDPATEANLDYEDDQQVVVTPWDPNGRWVQFNFDGQYDMKVGDVVTLTDGLTPRTYTVRNLSITGVNQDAEIVSGMADEGATVYVWPHATGQQLEVTAGSGGIWQADFTGIFDIAPGEGGRAEIRDDAGNATAVDWYVPNPRFVVFPEWEWFDGLDWPDGATVTITVDGKPECTTAQQSSGFFFNGSFGEGCDLVIGDTVTFTDGFTTRTHTVRNLSVSGMNADTDVVSGAADPGALVQVWPHGHDQYALLETTAEDGTWSADFGSVGFNLVPGIYGRSQIQDEAGNATAVDWGVPLPGWEQINVNGFGNPLSRGVTALESFRGQLYAGASNWETGGEIWRLDQNGQWVMVSEAGFGSGAASPAIIDLYVFQGQLYAGTGWNNEAPGQLWRSSDGTNWQPVTTTGFNDPNNIAITNFVAFKGMLYAGTGTIDGSAQIWRSRSGKPNSWEQVAPDGSGLVGNVTGFAVYKNILYAAIEPAGSISGTIQVWRSMNGSDWTVVTEDGFGDPSNASTGGFAQFGGYLYLGTRNEVSGAQLWRSLDGISWEQVVGDGFGDLNNIKIESLFVYNDLLYAATLNQAMGLQLWRSEDGVDWEQATANGFGDSANTSTLWNSATLEYQGRILIGTWNDLEGGELWRFTP